MGIVHIPRTVAAVARGFVKRRMSPLSEGEKSLVGIGSQNPPHVYTSRAGLFDVDLMLHMNNAAYLTHAELARWEWTAFGGILNQNLRSRSFFIVTASMVRFRREIAPLRQFEIRTSLGSLDARNLWVYQTFHYRNNGESGKVLAQIFTQGVITRDARVVDPRAWVADHVPAAKEALDDLAPTATKADVLFDETAARFARLEEPLRRKAALHDDTVTPR